MRCRPGEAFAVVAFVAAVGLSSAFAKNVSSAVLVLTANICFAALILAPFDASRRISMHTTLAIVGFFPSSLALTPLIHRLRKLNAIAHSGDISINNNPDYGAIFVVTLPPFR